MASKKELSIPVENGEQVKLYPFGAQCDALTDEQLKSPAFVAWLEEFRPEIFKQLQK